MPWIEIVGYAGSVLVAVSLTMRSLVRLRWLNLAGALAFTVYGVVTRTWPVLAVNGFIAVVNVFYLARMSSRPDYFELLEIRDPANRYLRRFLDFHAADVRRFFPAFAPEAMEGATIVFILRDMLPAGLLVCRPADGETLRIELDYVVPRYRDLACGRWFYREWGPVFAANGFRRFLCCSRIPAHVGYLRRLGFSPAPACGADCYELPVAS